MKTNKEVLDKLEKLKSAKEKEEAEEGRREDTFWYILSEISLMIFKSNANKLLNFDVIKEKIKCLELLVKKRYYESKN